MTQVHVITRFFDSAATAQSVKKHLIREKRFPPNVLSVHETTDGLADVEADTIAAYGEKLGQGGAVLMARVSFKPLNGARKFRDTTAEMGSAAMGDLVEQVDVNVPTQSTGSIFSDHRLLLTRRGSISRDPKSTTFHMANWPIPLLSRRVPRDQYAFKRHRYFASWPIGHLVPHRVRYGRFPFGFLVPHKVRYGRFPIGLLVPGQRYMAKFPFAHIVPGHKKMAGFPIGHLVPGHKYQAKFPFGHLVPGGRRMANWPFPLLINGKQGSNSLVPGHKYQANWPIDHLVPGHKFQANKPIGHLVSHKVRFGRFPIGLLVPGQKYQASKPIGHFVPHDKRYGKFPFDLLVPGHKYMANWIFPHTKPKGENSKAS